MKLGCVEALARCFVFVRACVKLGVREKLGWKALPRCFVFARVRMKLAGSRSGVCRSLLGVFWDSSGTLPGLFRESSGRLGPRRASSKHVDLERVDTRLLQYLGTPRPPWGYSRHRTLTDFDGKYFGRDRTSFHTSLPSLPKSFRQSPSKSTV